MNSAMLVLIIVVIYMAINIGIGIYGRKYASNTDDYLRAEKTSDGWTICSSAIGSAIGSAVIIGTAGNAIAMGYSAVWYPVGCALAAAVFAVFLTRYVYRNRLLTFSDLFKQRYGGKFMTVYYSAIGPLANIGMIGSQILAGKAIFEAFGLDGDIGIVVMALVAFGYTLISGLWGSMATAKFQVITVFVGLALAFVYMVSQGGLAEIHNGYYPDEFFSFTSLPSEIWVMFVVPVVLGAFCNSGTVQTTAAAKTEKGAYWGRLLSAIPIAVCGMIIVWLGMWSGMMFPDASASSAFVLMMTNKLPPIVGALFVAAILAAIMSTASGAFVITDAMIVHDLYIPFVNPKATEKDQKRLIWIINIVLVVVSILTALAFNNIISLLSATYSLTFSGCLIPIAGAILWKGATRQGAIAAVLCGLAGFALIQFGILSVPYGTLFPLIPSLIGFVVVSLFTKQGE